MNKKDIITGNVLIARFMATNEEGESKVLEHDLNKEGTAESMHYHDDWNWLMPAVDKVYQYANLHDAGRDAVIETFTGELSPIYTWSKVVNWVIYYNNNKNAKAL